MKSSILKISFLLAVMTLFAWIPATEMVSSNTMQTPVRHTVKILHMKFIPENIIVNKGDTVVWENKDFFQHDVTDEKNNAWSSGPVDQGKTWSKVITKDENYICNLHKVMKGTIKVK